MSLQKSWDLQIDPSVFKVLHKIPRHDAEVILEVIRLLPTNPHFGDIQKMKGEDNTWRRRIGSYRIFFRIKITEKVVLVFHLERGTSKTY
ncbi:MAG: type II toxin-antitoxin system RelE/ParE family toxin [Candidatus Yanofskybacteria bacterium]|nr:type II toxin-antitoxin system RelE/ParE family toxin [Candidatus Yanofskybacteria bacterium]